MVATSATGVGAKKKIIKEIKMDIQQGDTVRHKTKILINGGLAFNVIDVDDDKALCSFFDSDPDQTMKEEWFDVSDLILVHKAEGGFKNAGEA